jgi:hypothetical protein
MATNLPVEFTPVPVRPRHDGWTAERQIAFIEALAETACVDEACRRVGVARQSAYRLRLHESAAQFRRAWDAALDDSLCQLEQAALGRALNGVAVPIFHKGEQIGERREYDERLTMFLLRSRRPQRFGKWMDRMLAPEAFDREPSERLADALIEMEIRAFKQDIEGEDDDHEN